MLQFFALAWVKTKKNAKRPKVKAKQKVLENCLLFDNGTKLKIPSEITYPNFMPSS
jgi:hypothetical protein